MLMTARDQTVGAIVRECNRLRDRQHVSTSLNDLAGYVARLAGLGLSTVLRAFRENPSWYPLEALLDGNLDDMRGKMNVPDRCSDLPGRPLVPPEMLEKRTMERPPDPSSPIGPGSAAASPQVNADPLAGAGPRANFLASTLHPDGSTLPPPRSRPWFSKIGRVTEFDDDCAICGGWVEAGSGRVLIPYPNKTSPLVICDEPGHFAMHAAAHIVNTAATDVPPPSASPASDEAGDA